MLLGDSARSAPLVLTVPNWAVPVLRRRKLTSGGGPLFPVVERHVIGPVEGDPSHPRGIRGRRLRLGDQPRVA